MAQVTRVGYWVEKERCGHFLRPVLIYSRQEKTSTLGWELKLLSWTECECPPQISRVKAEPPG